MSYFISAATAVCTVSGLDSVRTAALAVYDYLVNHPDEIPTGLDESDSDEVVEIIERYLSVQQDTITIAYDSESDEGNHDSEIFDFLSTHFACLQTSPFMEVTWTSFDTRHGSSGHTDYYDRSGSVIDISAVLTAHLSA